MALAGRIGLFLIVAMGGATLDGDQALAVDPLNRSPVCGVFDPAPCAPAFCGVFGPWPCVPVLPSLGQGLLLTVASRSSDVGRAPTEPINNIPEMFDALRACWEPPVVKESLRKMQMTAVFSYKRNGELFGPPRVTYTSPEVDPETRRLYLAAIVATLKRCVPMPFTETMAGAIAGRPVAVRFIGGRIGFE